MEFYESIATYYDEIFPYKPQQLHFVEHYCPDKSEILDIGCATGALASALQSQKHKVTAIDLDEKMVQKATQRDAAVSFRVGDMLQLQKQFAEQQFDAILCFGNTLVHLASTSEVENSLQQQAKLLRSNGMLLLQIIDYDTIFNSNKKGLPTLETSKIRFERFYHYNTNDKSLDFETKLTLKIEKKTIQNTVRLLALRKQELEQILYKVGASEVNFFGDFKRNASTTATTPLVVAARF